MLLHLITALAAMVLASRGMPPAAVLVATLSGGGLMAGAANVLNCYLDRDLDKLMARTRNRPLPAGRLSAFQALAFAIGLGISGLLILGRIVSWPVAALALGALVYYVLIYTAWLKRRTYWSSLIGSGAGAFPPLIGWLAVTGEAAATPFLLFAIIALWTPPHFWSLAIFRRRDYNLAALGVIPSRHTAIWILGAAGLLVTASIILIIYAHIGIVYSISAIILGSVLLALSARLLIHESPLAAQVLYRYSILYLVTLFSAMLIDGLI